MRSNIAAFTTSLKSRTSGHVTTRRCGSLRSSCSSPSLSLAIGLVVDITTGGCFALSVPVAGCAAPAPKWSRVSERRHLLRFRGSQ